MRQMLKFIFVSLSVVAVAYRCVMAQPPLQLPKRSIMSWMTDSSLAGQNLRKQLVNADADLRSAMAATGGKLSIVQPAQLQKALPKVNAATDYLELAKALKEKPITDAVKDVSSKIANGEEVTPKERELLQNFFKERSALWQIIERAASKEDCVFERDWSQGFEMLLPEYATIRQAATLLCARQSLLLDESKISEAITLAPFGYRMAKHAASDPLLIAFAVGLAINKSANRQTEAILKHKTLSEADLVKLREIISKNWFQADLSNVINGEVTMVFGTLYTLCGEKPENWAKFLKLMDDSVALYPDQRVPNDFTEEEKQFLNSVLDAAEARWIKQTLQDIEYRNQLFAGNTTPHNVTKEIPFSTRNVDPIEFLMALYPSIEAMIHKELAVRAQTDCLRLACDIFLHKARTGNFPTPAQIKGGVPTENVLLGIQGQISAGPESLTKLSFTYERAPDGFVVFCHNMPKGEAAEFSYNFVPND